MFRELDLKSAFTFGLLPGVWVEFDFDYDAGPEAPAPDDVTFLLQLEIGTKEDSWAESFSVFVVTPNNGPKRSPCTRVLELPRCSHLALKGHVTKTIAACHRETWDESLNELRRRFRWEYEPYQTV